MAVALMMALPDFGDPRAATGTVITLAILGPKLTAGALDGRVVAAFAVAAPIPPVAPGTCATLAALPGGAALAVVPDVLILDLRGETLTAALCQPDALRLSPGWPRPDPPAP